MKAFINESLHKGFRVNLYANLVDDNGSIHTVFKEQEWIILKVYFTYLCHWSLSSCLRVFLTELLR